MDTPNSASFDSSQPPFNADIAKQMAALNAANQIRMRSATTPLNPSGISSGTPAGPEGAHQAAQTQHNQPSTDPNMSQQRPGMPKGRNPGFLRGLAGVMASRNTPLPPALTGYPVPQYDPHTSSFNYLDIPEVGVVRLTGKDIDLARLWSLVINNGGGANVIAAARGCILS
jgi:SWI/SNF chromatin-remodeling complex subunit SWI1